MPPANLIATGGSDLFTSHAEKPFYNLLPGEYEYMGEHVYGYADLLELTFGISVVKLCKACMFSSWLA